MLRYFISYILNSSFKCAQTAFWTIFYTFCSFLSLNQWLTVYKENPQYFSYTMNSSWCGRVTASHLITTKTEEHQCVGFSLYFWLYREQHFYFLEGLAVAADPSSAAFSRAFFSLYPVTQSVYCNMVHTGLDQKDSRAFQGLRIKFRDFQGPVGFWCCFVEKMPI